MNCLISIKLISIQYIDHCVKSIARWKAAGRHGLRCCSHRQSINVTFVHFSVTKHTN